MIDTYAKITIVMRAASLLFLLFVLVKQIKILKRGGDLMLTKVLLTVFAVSVIVADVLSLVVNFYRDNAGNVVGDVRHATMIATGIAALMSGIALFVLYKDE